MANIFILGTGFGTALAVMADACGHQVSLWSRFESEIEAIRAAGEQKKLLPGVRISPRVALTSDISFVKSADICILAVPSFAIGEVCRLLSPALRAETVIVNVAKGFEQNTLSRLSQVISSEFPHNPVVVFSGPSHAEELARSIPTSVVVASENAQAADFVQDALMNDALRIYINDDLVGTEVGGALKNCIAVATGICDGLKLGDNTKAALMTRGLTEMARLGIAMGAKERTFAGLSGIGDLIVTCTSMHSRNRRAGILIGEGVPPADAVAQVGTVEGVSAVKAAFELAARHKVSMPIVEQLYGLLYGEVSYLDIVSNLMRRPKTHENETVWIRN